jgi:hypothetical protein
MTVETRPASVSKAAVWSGAIISGLAVLFLAFDGVIKIFKTTPVVEASEQLGIPMHTVAGIGILLLACTVIYAIPQTAVLGAILLTGYLGGAAAIHVRAGTGAFPVGFSVFFGVLVWVGLILREPRLLGTIILRK